MHLEIRSLDFRSGDATILRGIELETSLSGCTVIAGPSGAGKTSLLRQLNRLDAPTSGTVSWNGEDLSSTDICAMRRRIGHIAQRPTVFEGSVLENLRTAAPSLSDRDATELLDRIGLEVRLDQDARTLSGGEAQRLCLARTLATGATVVLADEPTSSLDAAATDQIERVVRQLIDQDGLAWIWVSHDVDQIRRLADDVIVVAAGELIAHGTYDDLADHDDVRVRLAVGAT